MQSALSILAAAAAMGAPVARWSPWPGHFSPDSLPDVFGVQHGPLRPMQLRDRRKREGRRQRNIAKRRRRGTFWIGPSDLRRFARDLARRSR